MPKGQRPRSFVAAAAISEQQRETAAPAKLPRKERKKTFIKPTFFPPKYYKRFTMEGKNPVCARSLSSLQRLSEYD